MALVDTGLIVRYYIDEAASGQVPGAVLDGSSVGADFDLAITYDATDLNYNEISGNRGLENTNTGTDARATKAINDTSDKVRDNIHGAQKATLEVVVRADSFAAGGGRCFGINVGTTDGSFMLRGKNGDIQFFAEFGAGVNPKVYRTWTDGVGTRSVFHIVVDTTLATADDRIKIYRDGTLITPTVNDNPALNDIIELDAGATMFMFNRGTSTFGRAMDGVLFYAALYSSAFTAGNVTTNFDILTSDDDTPAAGIVLLDGTAAAVSSLAGALPVDKALGGSIPAVAALSGELPVSRLMVSTVAAVSTLAGELPVDKGLVATIPATSIISGALALEWALAGTVPAVSTLTGDLTVPGEIVLSGVIPATSSLAGELPVERLMVSTVVAASTLAAVLGKYRAIDGSIDAASTVTGDLQILRALAGAIAGGSTLAGALKLEWALRGNIAGAAIVSGDLTVDLGFPWTRERLLTAKDISGPALRAPHRKEIE